MIISIHQPNFIPWIGYFYKIYKSDVFVVLDNVQFTKNGFINRNQIKTSQDPIWLTLPVIQSGKFGQNITDCVIFNKQIHSKKIISSLLSNYKKAPYFDKYFDSFSEIINKADDNLCQLNINLIKWIIDELEIQTKIILASDLINIEGESTQRLVSICKELGGTKYLAGVGAKKYQDDELFNTNQIEIINTSFKYPHYEQLWGDFIPNLSVLDVLFNCGPKTKNILRNSGIQ
jgi:hypothetical protein